jgi:hypothetical protein
MVCIKKLNTLSFYEHFHLLEVEIPAESGLISMDSIADCEPLWILKNFDKYSNVSKEKNEKKNKTKRCEECIFQKNVLIVWAVW